MTRDEARERVARGAALLDVREPGWRVKVNPGLLEMSSSCRCILGQALDVAYFSALSVLDVDIDEGDEDVRHGFDIGAGDTDADYDLLQDAWLEQLGAKP